MRKLLLLLALLSPSAVQAVSVSGVNGSLKYGNTIQIVGSDFGDKPVQEKTYFFANFEDASAGVSGSTFAVTTSMQDIVNVSRRTTNCIEGGGCIGSTADMSQFNNNTIRINHAPSGVAGGQLFVSWVWRWYGTPVPTNANLKTWRWYPSQLVKNNAYGAQQVDNGYVNVTESERLFVNGIDRFYTTRITPVVGADDQIEYAYQQSSAVDVPDGKIYGWKNNASFLESATWMTYTSFYQSAGRWQNYYIVHMVITGSGVHFPSDGDFRYDNLYLDTSWSAAYVTANSDGSGRKYWLVIQNWSSSGNSINAVWAQNVFSTGQTVYLRVRKKDLTTSAGFPLVVGAGYTAPPPEEPPPTPPPAGGSSADVGICPCLP